MAAEKGKKKIFRTPVEKLNDEQVYQHCVDKSPLPDMMAKQVLAQRLVTLNREVRRIHQMQADGTMSADECRALPTITNMTIKVLNELGLTGVPDAKETALREFQAKMSQ